jgi:hypothetical protein
MWDLIVLGGDSESQKFKGNGKWDIKTLNTPLSFKN